MQKTMITRLLPAALLALASGSASAAGFQLLEQNASGIGNAYAGSAAVAGRRVRHKDGTRLPKARATAPRSSAAATRFASGQRSACSSSATPCRGESIRIPCCRRRAC